MESSIDLKGSKRVIGIDLGSEKDKSVLTVAKMGKGGKIVVQASWTIVKQLTQKEVNTLPNGTRVLILWTGGNGPHVYWINRIVPTGAPWTTDHIGKVNFGFGPVDNVGEKPPYTLVWLLEQ